MMKEECEQIEEKIISTKILTRKSNLNYKSPLIGN